MRRSVLAIIGTVAGTALMVGAKLGTPAPGDPNAAALDAPGVAPSGDAASGAPPAADAPSTSPVPPAPGASSAASKPSGTGKPAPPPSAPPAAGGLKSGTFTGA